MFIELNTAYTNLWDRFYIGDLKLNGTLITNPSELRKFIVDNTHIKSSKSSAFETSNLTIIKLYVWYKRIWEEKLYIFKYDNDSKSIST